MKARWIRTKAFESVQQIPFVRRALALGWKHDASNARAQRWFYFRHADRPSITFHYQPESDTHLYTVGRDSVNNEQRALELLEAAASQ